MSSTNGKGDIPRPFSVSREVFEQNWDVIFGTDTPTLQQQEDFLDLIREQSPDIIEYGDEDTV